MPGYRYFKFNKIPEEYEDEDLFEEVGDYKFNFIENMKTETRRHLKSGAVLLASGTLVVPLLSVIFQALAEVVNQPVFADTISKWFGAGSLVTVLILTIVYRLVAWIVNYFAEKQNSEKGLARSMVEREDTAVKI